MKVLIEHIPEGEDEIIIRCQQLTSHIQEILTFIDDSGNRMVVNKDGESFLIQPKDIFYVETVDNKVFVYTKHSVFESQDSLVSIESEFSQVGLIRIGKSQLVNMHQITKLRSILHSRIEVTLESNERLIVSRHYAPAFKNRLGLES